MGPRVLTADKRRSAATRGINTLCGSTPRRRRPTVNFIPDRLARDARGQAARDGLIPDDDPVSPVQKSRARSRHWWD